MLENYLPLFNNQGSLISRSHPEINQVKRVMVNIIGHLYSQSKCPSKVFNTLYLTFLVESQYKEKECTTESILVNIVEVLSFHLNSNFYHALFSDNLPQTLMALFMYSNTTPL